MLLEASRGEIYDSDVLNDQPDALNKFQVHWVLFKIILSVLLILEFEDKAMAEAPLLHH